MPETLKIMGVDPGSNATGFGLVSSAGEEVVYLESGVIKLTRGTDRTARLRTIHERVAEVIAAHSPTHFAVEEVFYNKNPKSTMILGEARGAAILAAALADVPVFEYAAREVKLSVTGNGAAHKSQVNFMLGKLLKLSPPPESEDESDALAVAVCHAFRQRGWKRG